MIEINLYQTIKSFIDKIFSVPIGFLEAAADRLAEAGKITAQGLDFSRYFSVLRDLPTSWQMVVSSLFISLVLLVALLGFRGIFRMYFTVKDGVKWW